MNKSVNKSELIDIISADTGVRKKHTERVINKFIDVVKDQLDQGNEVKMVGFGNFTLKEREPHKARNPRYKCEVYVEHKRRFMKFKPSNTITKYLNRNNENNST